MSAERGWIGEPQPEVEWHDSHYSRMADRLDRKVAVESAHASPNQEAPRPAQAS
jgi:hypothetical protein